MNILSIRKGLVATICLSVLLSLLLPTQAFADIHYGTDPHHGWEGYFETGCNQCGHDNPQWFHDKSVLYCEECGALGYLYYLGEELPGNEPEPDSDPDDYDDWGYSDDEGDEDIPFEVVVGGGAIVGGAVVIMIRRARKKKAATKNHSKTSPKEKTEKNQDQPVGYILNLSQDNVFVTPQAPAKITVTVLRVYADQRTQIEPSTPITVSFKPDSGIEVLPPNGYGQLLLSIYQKDSDPISSEEYVNIIATIPGAQKSAQVKVTLTPKARVVFF